MSGVELEKLLESHQGELKSIAEAAAKGEREKVVDGVAALMMSVATGNPLVGALAPFARRAVAKAFGNSANEMFRLELAALEKAEQRQQFLGQIDDVVAALVGQAILQIVRSQHRVKDELLDALGGLRRDFDEFRRDFEKRLTDEGVEAVRIEEEQLVGDGATGVRVRETTTKRVILKRQIVSGQGSVGIDLE